MSYKNERWELTVYKSKDDRKLSVGESAEDAQGAQSGTEESRGRLQLKLVRRETPRESLYIGMDSVSSHVPFWPFSFYLFAQLNEKTGTGRGSSK